MITRPRNPSGTGTLPGRRTVALSPFTLSAITRSMLRMSTPPLPHYHRENHGDAGQPEGPSPQQPRGLRQLQTPRRGGQQRQQRNQRHGKQREQQPVDDAEGTAQ